MSLLRFLFAPLLIALAACTIGQENGGDIRLDAPIVADQSWKVTKKIAKGNDRLCSVSAGELEVTQRAHGSRISKQVAISIPFDPGDIYRVIMGNQLYETRDGWFSKKDSEEIIAQFMKGGEAYTELQEITFARHHKESADRRSNSIPLDTFAAEYQACGQFVR